MAVTRLRTGYNRATHSNKMEGTPDPDGSFCNPNLTLEHIRKISKTKEIWEKGEEAAKMLVKKIGLYYGL
jgi:hypothetical protein